MINAHISKKKSIILGFIGLIADISAFFFIFIYFTYFIQDGFIFTDKLSYFYMYCLVFLFVFMLIGGYSKKAILSISNNIKLIGVTVISMPFTYNYTLIYLDFSSIQGAIFVEVLFSSFLTLLVFRIFAIIIIRHSGYLSPKIIIIGDGYKNNLGEKYTYINVDDLINDLPYEEDPYFINTISKSVKLADRVILDFENTEDSDRYGNIVSSTSNNIEVIRQLGRLPVQSINNFQGYQTLKLKTYGSDFKSITLKRIFDLTLVILSAPLWVTVMGLCAIFIKIDSPGPIFFKQKRIGLRNEFFYIYKFRSMHHEQTDSNGSKLTEKNDIRVTKFGAFLRKSSLDELPQLINILKLEMSLVGPRPSTLEAKAGGRNYWDKFPDYWKRHMILPGMTGLAQIRGLRGNTFTKDDLIKRYRADIEYLDSWSIFYDIKIILFTFTTLFSEESF
jgi:lipopolysaccharide/colanic/teichoic acid biosynthesis glycosyltransferase